MRDTCPVQEHLPLPAPSAQTLSFTLHTDYLTRKKTPMRSRPRLRAVGAPRAGRVGALAVLMLLGQRAAACAVAALKNSKKP